MTITELSQILGNFGEFVGAIAVVATLVYLALQVRHSKEAMEANTKSLDEGRRLAMAQAYQSRAGRVEDFLLATANSAFLPEVNAKVLDVGVDGLSQEERGRLGAATASTVQRLDNVYYQYQQGFLDQEFYEHNFKNLIRTLAPGWEALGIGMQTLRPSFRTEVERILAEEEAQS